MPDPGARAELVVAQREWERVREKIHRITRTSQALSADRELLRQHAPANGGQGIVLEPGLRGGTYAQITAEDDQ